MKINSTRFGHLEIDDKRILTFPQGLLGLEGLTRYTLLHEENHVVSDINQPREPREFEHIVHYLQSIDDPELTFPLVDPSVFGFDYDLTLTDDDSRILQVTGGDYVAVMLIVSKYPEDAYRSDKPVYNNISANINGPLIINTRSRIGMQKVLPNIKYNVIFHAEEAAEQRMPS